jgi:hypothetical protein
MSRKDDVRQLIINHQCRLQKLEEQKASFGLHTPPYILTEIEDTEAKLEKLEAELAALKDKGTDEDRSESVADGTPVRYSGGGGHTFNIGSIEAANINLGGQQNFSSDMDINLDFSETTTQVESGGTYVAGDQFSGDFRRAMVNIKSQLDNVSQSIGALPNVEPGEKDELLRLVNELKTQLEQVPAEKVKEAEKVSKWVETLVEEVSEEKPDKEMVEITAESLKRAAENLAKVVPTVLPIVMQIAAQVMKFVG